MCMLESLFIGVSPQWLKHIKDFCNLPKVLYMWSNIINKLTAIQLDGEDYRLCNKLRIWWEKGLQNMIDFSGVKIFCHLDSTQCHVISTIIEHNHNVDTIN